MSAFTLATPWGPAQRSEQLGQGLFVVRTASHGGYFVPDRLLQHIPEHRRADAQRWSGSENWYEEDCCWAHVAAAFPDLFPPEAVETARRLNAARGL
jgi:hypothetical protein